MCFDWFRRVPWSGKGGVVAGDGRPYRSRRARRMVRGLLLLRYGLAPMMVPAAVAPRLNSLGTATFSAFMMACVTLSWER